MVICYLDYDNSLLNFRERYHQLSSLIQAHSVMLVKQKDIPLEQFLVLKECLSKYWN